MKRSRLSVVLAIVLGASTAVVIPAPPALAAVTFTSTAVNQNGGNCLNVPNANNGTQLVLASCNGAASQTLTFTPVSGTSDQYNIGTVNAGKCVDVYGASTADNTTIIQCTCHTNDN